MYPRRVAKVKVCILLFCKSLKRSIAIVNEGSGERCPAEIIKKKRTNIEYETYAYVD